MYTLLYLKWITNKDLLYGTLNSTQYCQSGLPGRGALGKNGYTYVCGWVPLLFTWNYHNIVNQLLAQFSHSVVSDSLSSHGLQHARPPCPSSTPGACSNSCPLSRWCHPTISSSVIPFSSHLQSFPTSGSFLMGQPLYQVAKILELQHQSFQWIFKTDFL